MKKNLLFILLFIAGCTSTKKDDSFVFQDIDIDFPVADTITVTPKCEFTISTKLIYSFKGLDSTAFVFEENDENFGHCYSLESGKELSTLIGRGKAANEMLSIPYSDIRIYQDSIQFPDYVTGVIKTFSVNDITTKPTNERVFSVIDMPDSIFSTRFIKIDSNFVVGEIINYSKEGNEKYFLYDGIKTSFFGEIKKELFKVKNEEEISNSAIGLLHHTSFTNYGNKVATAGYNGIALEVIDVNKRTVDFERYYGKTITGDSKDENGFSTRTIKCDNENIYCLVTKTNKEKTKEANIENRNIYDSFVLVFDWQLNPIKKYYLGTYGYLDGRLDLSEDGKTFYYMAIGEDKQELFEGKM